MMKYKLLIIGGCHLINDIFLNEMKSFYKLKTVKKIFTHIPDENFDKSIKFLIKENRLLNNDYDIIVQLGNLHYNNSIINLIPRKIRDLFLKNSHVENLVSEIENKSMGRNVFKSFLLKFVFILLKVFVFPVNLVYIPIKGYYVFSKLNKLFNNYYTQSKVIVFTPMKSKNRYDNIFRKIGFVTVKVIFKNNPCVRVFDFYNLGYVPHFYKGTYHLNDDGIIYVFNMFKRENLFS